MLKTIITLLTLQALFTLNSSSQWVYMSNGIGGRPVYSFATDLTNIFAGSDTGVFKSTNSGINWTLTTLNNRTIRVLGLVGPNSIFAGTDAYGVYLSTNNGTSWTQTSLNNRNITSLAIISMNIFAGTNTGVVPQGVYVSTNNGTTWTQTSLNNRNIFSLGLVGPNSIMAGTNAGVYLSTNNGTTWTQTSLNSGNILSLAVNGNNIFAGCAYPVCGGVYLSTNNGISWTRTSLGNYTVRALGLVGPNSIFAGTDSLGIFVSSNNGTSWIQRNEGFPPNYWIDAFLILNPFIFAGTTLQTVYRRPLSELVGITPISNEIPVAFRLEQNYPNPFNPNTKIKFALAKSSFAKIVVYDALGRELETVVNEQLNAGTYEVDWDAIDYPSGVYFYKLETEEFVEIRKMVLLK